LTPSSDPRAILGGTFDPIHRGHVIAAEQCRDQLGLPVVLMPANLPPHTPPPVAGAGDRLAMARLAVAGREGLEVSDLEVRRGGVSYAIDTVRELAAGGPRPLLLLGWDAALEFAGWREADTIPELADIVVFSRAGASGLAASRLAGSPLEGRARLLTIAAPDISATRLRAGLGAGDAPREALEPAVIEYIQKHRLYRET
jgi:nicotinate-nucleotide adenylyltransferase